MSIIQKAKVKLTSPPPSSLHPSQTTTHDTSSSSSSSSAKDIEDIIIMDGSKRQRPPIVPALCPYQRSLKVGVEYRWCSCGRSQDQPFCDDSHHDDDPQPLLFMINTEQSIHYLCGCTPPFCDGSHIHAREGYEEEAERKKADNKLGKRNGN